MGGQPGRIISATAAFSMGFWEGAKREQLKGSCPLWKK